MHRQEHSPRLLRLSGIRADIWPTVLYVSQYVQNTQCKSTLIWTPRSQALKARILKPSPYPYNELINILEHHFLVELGNALASKDKESFDRLVRDYKNGEGGYSDDLTNHALSKIRKQLTKEFRSGIAIGLASIVP